MTTSGVGGGISILEQYKIEKGIFTADDISMLLISLGMVQDALSSKDVKTVYAKLKSFISSEWEQDIAVKTNQLMFDLSSWLGSQDSNQVFIIKAEMEQKHKLSFSYVSRKGKEDWLEVEPHRLVFKNNQWYLQGYSVDKRGFRLFKLRRMNQVQRTAGTFKQRVLPHPFSDFTQTMSQKTTPIKLLIKVTAVDRILDYCTLEDLQDVGNGKVLVDFNFIPDDYGYGILLSFGDQLTCIEPAFVRDELRRRLNTMLMQYNP